MNIRSTLAMLLGVLLFVFTPAGAQTNEGKEFWLAIPLNEGKTQPTISLEIYVTSQYNATVTLEVPGAGFLATKKIKAYEVATFTTKNATANFDWEVVSSQVPDNKGIHIFGDKPLSVYIFNGKDVTADGYMAMPINSWGTEYVHCAYYDFNEYRPLGAGFVVIAAYDSTKVSMQLKGKGKGYAKTQSGSSLGDTLEVMLHRGQVYNVVGDATTINTFDLTGSVIQSDKPIGVISYHQRTLLPQNSLNGRDHLVEMLRPTSAWGKKHVTLEFIRDNKGDFFRIVACRDNTKWSLKYYDKLADTLLGQRSGILNRGEFFEDYNNWIGKSAIAGIRGVSVWESDKPTMVMQYQYSANWDRGDNFDPDMVLVTPVEQFMRSSLFQAPSNPTFKNNWFNYIIEGDSTDTNNAKLKSFAIDGDTVYKSYPQLLLNQVPGTNYYWGYTMVSPGPHVVTTISKFGGYVYGIGSYMGYSWPAGSATRSLDALDTLPPVLTFDTECGDYNFLATELRRFSPTPDSGQYDIGIFDIHIIDSLSYNYTLNYSTSPTIIPIPIVTEFKFDLKVIDKTRDAFAVVQAMDRAGNYVLDTLRYEVEHPRITESTFRFPDTRVGTVRQKNVSIINPSSTNKLVIKSITLLRKKEYRITDGTNFPEIEIAPSDSHSITLEYTPFREGLIADDDGQLDIDSILVSSTCATFSFPVKGRGVVPCADVEPLWKAPITGIGDTTLHEKSGFGLRISNKGTDTLHITGISGVRPPFFYRELSPALPFVIAPGKQIFLQSIGFAPTSIKSDTIYTHLETDSKSANCNVVSIWIGTGSPSSVESDFESKGWEITNRDGILSADSNGVPLTNGTLSLYNNLGQLLVSSPTSSDSGLLSIPTRDLSMGVYLAVIRVGNQLFSKTVLIP